MPLTLGISPAWAFFIQAFHIALFAYLDGAIAKKFPEVAMLNHAAHAFSVSTQQGDESGEENDTGFHEEFGDFVPRQMFSLRSASLNPKSEHRP